MPGKVKIKDISQETVTFTHVEFKRISITPTTIAGGYRIDVVARKYSLDGTKKIYDDAEIVYTTSDLEALVRQMMLNQDGINPSNVDSKIEQAWDKADKGNSAEQFAGMLELGGKILLENSLIDYDMVEQ